MCGRFAQSPAAGFAAPAASALEALDASLDVEAAWAAREPVWNLAPSMSAGVMARGGGRIKIKSLQWGLVPGWAKDGKIAKYGINARSESVADKPMFRNAFRKRRCVVPMSGYFEWQATGAGKQPYFIHAPDQSLLLCAGIWEAWRPDEAAEPLRSFAVLTGAAGLVSGNVHDRQPVILPADRLGAWLDGSRDAALDALRNLPEADLTYHAVDRRVGSVRSQDASLVQPLAS